LFTVMACVPLLIIHPFSVGYVAFQAVQRLNAKRIEFERLSQHDGLSNLFNRRHWESVVRNEFARFARHGAPAVLVLADLDHFKRINDQHGHAAGDEAIRRFANLLNRVLRTTDVCGRYGGEEFGILLPDTDMPAAQEVIERLRSELYANTLMDGAVVTASFGLVQLDRDKPSVEAWLKQVDQMLYMAKAQGRDQLMDPATAARRASPSAPDAGASNDSTSTASAA
jgi:diguanylate cyclase